MISTSTFPKPSICRGIAATTLATVFSSFRQGTTASNESCLTAFGRRPASPGSANALLIINAFD